MFRFQGLEWELRVGFAEKAELRKDEVCGRRGPLWEPAVSGTQGMSVGRYPGDQGMPRAQRRSQGWDRVGGFIIGVDKMSLGWGRIVQLIKRTMEPDA